MKRRIQFYCRFHGINLIMLKEDALKARVVMVIDIYVFVLCAYLFSSVKVIFLCCLLYLELIFHI